MAQAPGWSPVPDASAAADGWTPVRPPDFTGSNATDAQGHSVVSDIASAWKFLNTSPLEPYIHSAAKAIADHISEPRASDSGLTYIWKGFKAGAVEGMGNLAAGFTTPIGIALTIAGLTGESSLVKAVPALKPLLELPAVVKLQRAVQGLGGAGFVAQGARDTFGPDRTLAQRAQGIPEMAAGAAGAASAVRPSLVAPAAPGAAAEVPRLTPQEAASNTFAGDEGIPLDAATATGSRTLRAMQKRTANSIGGEGIAEKLISDQTQALGRVGGDLAQRSTGVGPATPEAAGSSVRDELEHLVGNLHDEATKAYDQLRTIEADPKHAVHVNTADEGSPAFAKIAKKLAEAEHVGKPGGQPVLRSELVIMRQLEAELESQPYSQGGTVQHANQNAGTENDWTGGDMRQSSYVRGKGGTPVYQEILQEAPGTADMTRAEVLGGIRRTLETGDWNNASIGAYKVARARLTAGYTGGPRLVPGAPLLGTSETIALPVDLAPVKQALRPMYDRLMRERELVPLMGDKGRALVALDRLMQGPDHAQVSAVDGALGELKAMARGASMPELRTQGQGTAAESVKALDQAVRQAVARAGPDAVNALETGRAQTTAKYQVADVLEKLRDEPVQTFRNLTAKGDSQVGLLRRVSEYAPDAMPHVARAWVDQLLDAATERGRFDHADRLYAEWQKLGPQTKALMFPEAAHRSALDHFFLLAKRLQENPNPSGTASTNNVFNWASSAISWPAAKLLQTPGGAKFVARLMQMNLPAAPVASVVRTAAQKAAWVQVAAAARASGLQLATLPAAADSEQERGARQ